VSRFVGGLASNIAYTRPAMLHSTVQERDRWVYQTSCRKNIANSLLVRQVRYKDELHRLRISEQSSVSIAYHKQALKDLETRLGQAGRSQDAAVNQLANFNTQHDQATKKLSRAVPVGQPYPAAVPVDLRQAGQAAVPVDQSSRATVTVDVAKTLKDRDNELDAVKKQLEQAKRELQSVKNELATSKRNLQEALQANAAINEPFEQAKTRVSELDLEVQTLTNARVQLEQDLRG
jgi:chromosome segregation ATPase